MLCKSCTENSATIRGGDCNTPRTCPIYIMYCNHVYKLVSQVYISWWAYVLFRLESLGVKGQEPDFCYVVMQIIHKI
jgi:hypothetical protein